MATLGEIRARVTGILVQALGVEAGDVTPSATLFGDLGAESIDLLDIVFRLGRGFGVKIPRGELFIEPFFREDSEFVQDGRWTEEGLEALREQMPYADLGHDAPPGGIAELFTVDLLVRYIAWKLEGRGGAVACSTATAPVMSGPTPR
jgi:acyl carrier protein